MPSPVYMQIRQYVLGLVLRSKGKPIKIMSLRKLCKAFNCSIPTARKALGVLLEENYLMTVHGVGTFVNPYSLQPDIDKPMIGIIVEDGTQVNISETTLLAGILTVLGKYFYPFKIINLSRSGKESVEEIGLYSLDGLFWIHPTGDDAIATIRKLQDDNFPVITSEIFCNCPEDIRQVSMRPASPDETGAEYFIKKGYRRVVWIGPTERAGFKAFPKYFKNAGVPLEKKYIIADDRDTGGVTRLKKYIFNDKITAVYSHGGARLNNIFPVLQQAREKGIEIDFVTYDCINSLGHDDLISAKLCPPYIKIGNLAAEKLHEMITKGSRPENIFLETELKILSHS